ncbi:hypothetical protein B484DRAFT_254472 [Ochromonadaceae sp. CCMP2298]|nr:hypothetical protein B484DRAFT_254472 [Ochromonadaceae sp. CCMP2298]
MLVSRCALRIAIVFLLIQKLWATCPSYTISTIAGSSAGSSGDGGAATSAKLTKPYGVWGDDAGYLYIADAGNHRVRKIALSTGIITPFAGTGTDGYSGDGGPALNAAFETPMHIMGDGAGKIYISDYDGDVVRVVDTSSTVTSTANDVKVNSGGYIASAAGNGVDGYNGDNRRPTDAWVNMPAFLYMDVVNNKLYFTEYGQQGKSPGCRLRRVDRATGLIFTMAGDGTCSHSGDGGLAINARINEPWGLWLDSSSNIYIGTGASCRVRRIDASTGVITTFAGTSR